MAERRRRLTIAIPTYRRPRLLARILVQLQRQTQHPERLVVIDGEGGRGDAEAVLERSRWAVRTRTVFVPSTHANLPFQRWLGRRSSADSDDLIFFDDDLLLPDIETVAKLTAALAQAEAATCAVNLPLRDAPRTHLGPLPLALLRRAAPGSLTPGGARRQPAADGSPLPAIEWLRGPVMAVRCSALPPERFPYDLFALASIGSGMGEELALARCLQGRIVFVRNLTVEHPDTEPSQVLASQAERKGFAIAYSRRLLNDLCRNGQPSWSDRAGLAWTWCGGMAAAAADGLSKRRPEPWRFAKGYLRGALGGALCPPTHARLTPGMNWEEDARRSLAAAVTSKEAACRAASV